MRLLRHVQAGHHHLLHAWAFAKRAATQSTRGRPAPPPPVARFATCEPNIQSDTRRRGAAVAAVGGGYQAIFLNNIIR